MCPQNQKSACIAFHVYTLIPTGGEEMQTSVVPLRCAADILYILYVSYILKQLLNSFVFLSLTAY